MNNIFYLSGRKNSRYINTVEIKINIKIEIPGILILPNNNKDENDVMTHITEHIIK